MYYFYIIISVGGRIGFGIAQDIRERNKQYCSHAGDIVKMYVYGGQRTHAKALERTIKTQYIDNIWVIEDWRTEWLNDSVTADQVKSYVDQLIQERHFRLNLLAENYDFTQELLV
jgi:predicted GIY-YIG superfamily endonuclease